MSHGDNPLKGVIIIPALEAYGIEFMKGVAAANDRNLIDEGPLSKGEAELVATLTSIAARSTFCSMAHCAISGTRLDLAHGEVEELLNDYASSELSEEMKATLSFVEGIATGGDVALLWPEYAPRVPREKLEHALRVCRLFLLQANLAKDFEATNGVQASLDPNFYQGVTTHFQQGGTYTSMLEAYIASKQETKE